MRTRHRRRLRSGGFELPDGVQVLKPDWVAALAIYWRTQPAGSARQILSTVELAMYEATPERSVYVLQQALRQLGLIEVQMLRLILTRYVEHARLNAEYPAQQIAAEVLVTLLAIEADKR